MDMDLGGAFMSPIVQMQKIAESEAQTGYLKAHTEQALAQAAEHRAKVEAQQRLDNIMRTRLAAGGATVSGDEDMSDLFDSLARDTLAAGFTKEARDFSNSASQRRLRDVQMLRNQASADLSAERANNILFERSLKTLGGVNSQESLNTWNAMWESLTGQRSPMSGMAYTPDLVRKASDDLLAVQGKMTNAMRERKTRIDERIAEIRARSLDERIRANKERENMARERLERTGKTGDKEIKAPTAGMVKEAGALVMSEFTKQGLTSSDLPPNEAALASRAIASRARSLMQSNPGLDQTMAIRQAFDESKRNGDLGWVSGFAGMTKQAKFAPQGMSPTMALPMETDPAKRTVGKYYLAPNGNVYQWQKGGWKIAEQAASRSVSTTGVPKAGAYADDNADLGDDEDEE